MKSVGIQSFSGPNAEKYGGGIEKQHKAVMG